MRLRGKRALISGSARGIGLGIAERFRQEGASVVLLDYREEELAAAAAGLKDRCPEQPELGVCTVVCDMSDPAAVERAADEAWSRFGGLDLLVNNAGVATREPFLDIPLSRWQRTLDINLTGMFRLSQLIAGRMVKESIRGAIVNMASKNGVAGSTMLAHYNASKGGVVLLTESMASDLARYGIRVNAVAPGFIDTPLDRELKQKGEPGLELTARTPMGRLGTVEEVANAFLFLASDEASYITGATLVVDGGHLANAGDL
ncbi:3-oxoacyl-ACP reductase [Paenibacillus sp. J31TS4]|uniref:SDR family NAD(P)-dependent oxidoreductase n=1 Tax=Paenibacillus sp. J31TS4 TaxID=2807195 RepID=UPI001B26B2F9|nr:SDR family NAD(P)-dependent oxidoreductase [Paenibacillus sp. J31TS4]GIP39932.1 3-oxoacyl-ACP reductase [Paenibacillus sp. J31TS4]